MQCSIVVTSRVKKLDVTVEHGIEMKVISFNLHVLKNVWKMF